MYKCIEAIDALSCIKFKNTCLYTNINRCKYAILCTHIEHIWTFTVVSVAVDYSYLFLAPFHPLSRPKKKGVESILEKSQSHAHLITS